MKNKKIIVIIIAIVLVLVAGGVYWYKAHSEGPFCFNFVHNTAFGDRDRKDAVNTGIQAPNGMFYYIPEVPALHTALTREGFYIDPYEATGGKVYLGAFFGPSSQVAVRDFQAKYKLPVTGTVENDMIDKLSELYKCPADIIGTSTEVMATTTIK